MVQASRSRGLRSNDDAQPSDGVVLHGYLERFVTTSGKDDLGRRLCFLDGVRRQVGCCSAGKIPFPGNRDFGSTSRRKMRQGQTSAYRTSRGGSPDPFSCVHGGETRASSAVSCFTGTVSISEAMAEISRPRPQPAQVRWPILEDIYVE